jgi:hypothetical protein
MPWLKLIRILLWRFPMNNTAPALVLLLGLGTLPVHGEVRGGRLGTGPDSEIQLLINDRKGNHDDLPTVGLSEKTSPSEILSRADDLFESLEEISGDDVIGSTAPATFSRKAVSLAPQPSPQTSPAVAAEPTKH